MPNAAHRITDTTINAMNLVLFTLNSFNSQVDIQNHLKLYVIFNDVSMYGDDYDPLTVEQSKSKEVIDALISKEKRVVEYKTQLKEKAKKFYLHADISDETKFGDRPWHIVKKEVFTSDNFTS